MRFESIASNRSEIKEKRFQYGRKGVLQYYSITVLKSLPIPERINYFYQNKYTKNLLLLIHSFIFINLFVIVGA